MLAPRTIRRRMFLAIFAVAMLPAAVGLLLGAYVLREAGATAGTLGPWDLLAESGSALVDEALRAAPGDSALVRAAEAHRQALSESVRQSRLWAYVADRFARTLPLLTLLSAVLLGATAFWVAGRLSRSFSGPVAELVGWTRRIAASEPLPVAQPGAAFEVLEYAQLREALRRMAEELAEGRRREVESARLRAWTEMARRVAHDLKNPLTPMQLAAGMLAGSADPNTAAAAAVLLEEIARLDGMARSFAQLGRAPESPASEVDLAELLERLAGIYATDQVPIRVGAEGPPAIVTGHYDVLERVFRNLLVNAVEASDAGNAAGSGAARTGSPAGSTAGTSGAAGTSSTAAGTSGAAAGKSGTGAATDRIDVRVVRENGEVQVTIRDRGPGLPVGALESIWLPDVTTKRGGTGLGLAIVQQGVEAHRGRVHAVNAAGGGAEFHVVLPVDAVGGPAGSNAPVPPPPRR